jgi:type I restriction enzyme S subunit
VGEVHFSADPCFPIDTTYYVDDFSGMPAKYWYYQLRQLELWGLNKSTAIPGLNREDAYREEIFVVPVEEQRRIVAKVDAVLARLNACRERLDRVPQILKRFREAVLEAAVSGRLTEEWRATQNKVEAQWDRQTVGDVLHDLRYGTAVKCSYGQTRDTPVLRIPNVAAGKINISDLKYGKLSKEEQRRLSLHQGDILLIRSNGSTDLVGRVAVVPEGFEEYSFAGYLIRLRPNLHRVIAAYLALVISGPKVRAHLELTARSTSGVNNLNSDEVRAIEVPLPELAEQVEIVRRVEELFALSDNLQQRYQDAAARFEKITPSVLSKAFRGELVPQNPDDEPAEEMLERIRAGKSAGSGGPAAPNGENRRRRATRLPKPEGGRRLHASSQS